MDVKLIIKTARSATIFIDDGGIYYTKKKYDISVNGSFIRQTDTAVTSLFGLIPDTEYTVSVEDSDGSIESLIFKTDHEFVTLNIRDFGAKGDGVTDDTRFIQAAIYACPKDSRILIPKGKYAVASIFLKSHIRIEIAKDAELSAVTDKDVFPQFPGLIESYDERDECYLGTWEGNPLPMYSGIITGMDVKDVIIYGEGCVNGNASFDNWWAMKHVKADAFRPRMFFINRCENITLQGLKFCNSPSWTLHPFFSKNLKFIDLNLENPSDSPNTDGLNPESCDGVEIAGIRFSLGDDCIAIKSGKLYMGMRLKTPSQNIHIYQCLMEDGHGAVTIGSEMSGGVKNVLVDRCLFNRTDRGLRIKTRRGRGKYAIIDDVVFRDINMDNVLTPFVINCFYFCDPDGTTEYVQSREVYPVDDRTPHVKRLCFENIVAENTHVAAAYFEGLPEQKIEEIVLKNVNVTYADKPQSGCPIMSSGVEECSLTGVFAKNVKKLVLENVNIEGNSGDEVAVSGVDEYIVM